MLAVIYVESGSEIDAQAQVDEVLKLSPNYSLEMANQTLPFKDHAQQDRCRPRARRARESGRGNPLPA